MRILAIRGSDLASLAGPFELDLSRSPLAEAPLFVITGPVGAGKSTLLDALSVALFHRTSRLVETCKERTDGLPAEDARNLLRHGAPRGFAEVDFQADDGQSYRARWEVRRAAGQAEGAIQKPSCRLSTLQTGHLLRRGVNKTRSEISRLLGLDFRQFQRAVLLAQGEFAGFLKAASNERAALLEQLTGTELYRRVSIAAYERATRESERANSLQREINRLQAMEPEEVEALQAQLKEIGNRLQHLDELRRSLEREKNWFTREEELGIEKERATAEQAGLLAQEPGITELKKELALTETALSLSSWFSTVDELEGHSALLNSGLEKQKRAVDLARERRQIAKRAVDQARDALQTAQISRHGAEQALEEAVKLDERSLLAEQAVKEAEARARKADETRAAVEENLSRSRELLLESNGTWKELTEFQAATLDQAGLFTEQKYWLEQILQYERLREDEVKSRQALITLSATIADLIKKEQGVSHELSTESSEIERLEAVMASLEAEIAALGPTTLTGRLEEAQSRQEQAAALEKSHAELRILQAEVDRIQAERGEAIHESFLAQSAIAELDSRLPALGAAATEAQRAWRSALSSGKPGVEALRAELRPGTPCPVCGALDHAWLSVRAPVLGELVEKSRKRLEALVKDLATLHGRRAQQQTYLEQLKSIIRRADTRLQSLVAERDRLRAVLDDGAVRLGLTDPRTASQALAAFKSRVDATTKDLRVVHDKEAVLRNTGEQLKSRRRLFERHRVLHSKLRTDLSVARSREESLVAQLSALLETRERLKNLIATAFATILDAPGGNFSNPEPASTQQGNNCPPLKEDPEQLRRILATQADKWKRKLEQLEATRRRIAVVKAEIDYQEQETARASAASAEAHTGLRARKAEAVELAQKRSLLFDGQAVAAIRVVLDGQVESARQARQAAEDEFETANVELMRQETAVGAKAEHLHSDRVRVTARQSALQRKLRKHGLAEDEARQLISRGASWCRETRDIISDYENRVKRARERLKLRERQLRSHERTRPERRREEADRLFVETIEERQALDCSQGDIRVRLIHAQSVEERIRELTEELYSLEEGGRVWIELGEIIGSADGTSFRNFAQTYTLDLLLDHSNMHLAKLKPRYRMRRSHDESDPFGILILDEELGDEPRPVITLSEGETFLVSLALALGLSSLQSQRVRLESLFIDEGFGTLDSTALQTVLGALQALELRDRQIAIISHVGAFTDHFPAEVRVVPLGFGTSRLEIS
jgi:DNA repair protein SbcC/Rad50